MHDAAFRRPSRSTASTPHARAGAPVELDTRNWARPRFGRRLRGSRRFFWMKRLNCRRP